jgi:hypothetical protein
VFRTPAGPTKKPATAVNIAEVKAETISKVVQPVLSLGKSEQEQSDSGNDDSSRKSSLSSVDSRASIESQGKTRKGKESLVPGVRQSARLRAKTEVKPARY